MRRTSKVMFFLTNVILFAASVAWRFAMDLRFQNDLRFLEIPNLGPGEVNQLLAFDFVYALLLGVAAYRIWKLDSQAVWSILLANIAVIYSHLFMPAFYAWFTDTGLKDAAVLVIRPIGFVLTIWAVANCVAVLKHRKQPVLSSV